MGQRQPTQRERYRAQIRAEVKELALTQLADLGPGGLSLNAIAHGLGMSGPALYRYFANRDELLTELVQDSYEELADALWSAVDATAGRPLPGRLRTLAGSYRSWALTHPHRYMLLFGTPVPGFHAHGKEATAAAQRAIQSILALLPETVLPEKQLREKRGRAARSRDPLDVAVESWAKQHSWPDIPGRRLRMALTLWTRLHGVISLELEGHFEKTLPPGELLYESEVADIVDQWEDLV